MKAPLNLREMLLGNGKHQKKCIGSQACLFNGAEILAEVVRQTPACLGRTKQHVSACGQGTGIGDEKRESSGGSSCREGRGLVGSTASNACWHCAEGRRALAGRGGKL